MSKATDNDGGSLMRWGIGILVWMSGMSVALSNQVCLERVSGRLIEYQSRATPGTCLRNAVASGYTADQVIETQVSDSEWEAIRDKQIEAPIRQREKENHVKQQAAMQRLREKGIDVGDIRDALAP